MLNLDSRHFIAIKIVLRYVCIFYRLFQYFHFVLLNILILRLIMDFFFNFKYVCIYLSTYGASSLTCQFNDSGFIDINEAKELTEELEDMVVSLPLKVPKSRRQNYICKSEKSSLVPIVFC